MGPGGVLEALVEAREEGLVRFIGVTGHGTYAPAMHRQSLEAFEFDSILTPYNYAMMQNQQYAADFDALYALCQHRGWRYKPSKQLRCGVGVKTIPRNTSVGINRFANQGR